jgi:hypothetical protein
LKAHSRAASREVRVCAAATDGHHRAADAGPPSSEELAQQGSSFDTLKSDAESSVDESAPDDVSPEADSEESDISDALKKCLEEALLAAASAAAANEGIASAFLGKAESCLSSELASLSPTTEAIQNAADYLQAGVGGAVAGEEPPPVTTTTSSPEPTPTGSGGFPWWGWVLGVAGVIGVLSVLGKK